VVFLAVCCYLSAISTYYSGVAGAGPVLHDIGFKLFAFNPIYPNIADIILLVADVGFFAYVIGKRLYDDLPFYLICMALFQLLRAAILPLTPLPTPIESSNFGILGSLFVTKGTFPSGHAGQVFLLFFLVSWRDRKSKYAMLALAFLISFFLIAGRGHYTIDVVSSFFIVFFIYTVMSRYWAKVKEKMF
jgi:PAP2 superfamily protein